MEVVELLGSAQSAHDGSAVGVVVFQSSQLRVDEVVDRRVEVLFGSQSSQSEEDKLVVLDEVELCGSTQSVQVGGEGVDMTGLMVATDPQAKVGPQLEIEVTVVE